MDTLRQNVNEMSLAELEEMSAALETRKAELKNSAALEHRAKLKSTIMSMFDSFRDQVLLNCGNSIEMLEEASEKLKTYKLSTFLSAIGNENRKPLDGVMTEEGCKISPT
jgi:hypothetical protein